MTNDYNAKFYLDGYNIPNRYDTNKNRVLSSAELNIWLDEYGYTYKNHHIDKKVKMSSNEVVSTIIQSMPQKNLVNYLKSFISPDTTFENIIKSLVNTNNIKQIMSMYEGQTGNHIISDIMNNRSIPQNTKINCVQRILKMYFNSLKDSKVYVDDYEKLMNEHIEYARKSKNMTPKYIMQDLYILSLREKNNNTTSAQTLDGKLNNKFAQGAVSDCWLIAALKSLMASKSGQNELKNLISLKPNGDVVVTLKGVGKKYSITKKELLSASELSIGDLDVRAIEIAITRYLHETNDHMGLTKFINNKIEGVQVSDDIIDFDEGSTRISGAYHILFGDELVRDSKVNSNLVKKIQSQKYSICVTSHNDAPITAYDINKNIIYIDSYHIYSVISADKEWVYLKDPYQTANNEKDSDILKMQINDFVNKFDKYYAHKLKM